MTSREGEDLEEDFEAAGYLRTVRRLAGLSQRELALRVGVSASLIARVEAGKAEITASLLASILRVGGLRLTATDEQGRPQRPEPKHLVLDHAGRHYPAHLQAWPASLRDWPTGVSPRRARSPQRLAYRRRSHEPSHAGPSHAGRGTTWRNEQPMTQEELARFKRLRGDDKQLLLDVLRPPHALEPSRPSGPPPTDSGSAPGQTPPCPGLVTASRTDAVLKHVQHGKLLAPAINPKAANVHRLADEIGAEYRRADETNPLDPDAFEVWLSSEYE